MTAVQNLGYDQFDILFCGYFRNIESIIQQKLPKDIMQMIVCYQKVLLPHGARDVGAV